jgi:type I restriction enzyme S subunit
MWWNEVARLRNVGAVFSSLNVKDIARIRIPVPELAEQRAIAEVLGALDDKIAANSHLALTADRLANVRFAEALRAAEWSPSTFGDVALVSGGGTPSTKVAEYWDGDINWATPTDVTGLTAPYLEATARRITEVGLESCASALHPVGSILMTSRATIGAFAIAQAPTAVNQGFIVANAKRPEMQWWLFHEMRSRVDEFLSHANGATFLELSRGNFKRLQVRLADVSAMRQFGETAEALHGRARAAAVENQRLAITRDALLPQLMSGKIRVGDAERAVSEVV